MVFDSFEKISIIVPVYNVEKYLSHCLDSLLNQTFSNIEILCINDGSKDNSLSILNQYARKDNRVRVFNKDNSGLSDTRNFAIQFVTGKYIMYVDSDDWLDPETCQLAIDAINETGADVVFWNYIREYDGAPKPQTIFSNNDIIFETKEQLKSLHRRFVGLYQRELLNPEKANSIDTAWGKLYKADLIVSNNIKFVDTKLIGTEDALFNIFLFANVKKAVYISNCLYHYRKNNESSLTKTYKKYLYSQWNELFTIIYQFLIDNQYDKSFFEALNNRIALSIIGLGLNCLSSKHPIHDIKSILKSEKYIEACKALQIKYLSFIWRVFFLCVKAKNATMVFILLKCVKILKGKNDGYRSKSFYYNGDI